MINKPLSNICEQDLHDLIANEVSEGRTIEYKRELPADTREGRTEFVADVTSFSNTSGGDLIFGITESAGNPIALTGIEINDVDALGLRLENICRDKIEYRISPLQFKSVRLDSGLFVVIVRIAQSWQQPHRNGYDQKFYARNSKGKFPMDISEIRTAFTLQDSLERKVEHFLNSRYVGIQKKNTPKPLNDGIQFVFHMVPIEAFSRNKKIDLNQNNSLIENFSPMGGGLGASNNLNLDGAVIYSGAEKVSSYTQLFRNGIVESVFVPPQYDVNKKPLWLTYETYISRGAQNYLLQLRKLDFLGPISLSLSIFSVEGSYLHVNSNSSQFARCITESRLDIPSVLIQNDDELFLGLKEIFEVVWNSYGEVRPQNYIIPEAT